MTEKRDRAEPLGPPAVKEIPYRPLIAPSMPHTPFCIDSERGIVQLALSLSDPEKGVLFAPSDTDVSGDVEKSRSRSSGDD